MFALSDNDGISAGRVVTHLMPPLGLFVFT